MRRRLILVSLVGLLVACYGSQYSACGTGPTPTPAQSPTPTPSSTPSPSPTVRAESCAIDYMTLRPIEGVTLATDASAVLDLTPYQTIRNEDGTVAQREVSRACNEPRAASVSWASSSAAVTLSSGFNPTVRRVGIGEAVITATLEGKVSNSITIR